LLAEVLNPGLAIVVLAVHPTIDTTASLAIRPRAELEAKASMQTITIA
jgi:hypothetical protein